MLLNPRRRDVIELNEPVLLETGDTFDGEGMIYRLAPGCVLPAGQAMFMTKKFHEAVNKNMWKYLGGVCNNPAYVPYSEEAYLTNPNNILYSEAEGMHIQCTIKNLIIDGNARNGSKGGGIYLYGKGHRISNFEIMDIHSECQGIWTECGNPNNGNANSWQGNAEYKWKQQVESMVTHGRLNTASVLHRGPNDSLWQNIFIHTGKFVVDHLNGAYSGLGAKLNFIHCYPDSRIIIIPWGCYGDNIYVDTPTALGGGPGFEVSGDCMFTNVKVTGHEGSYPAIKVTGHNNQITNILYHLPRQPNLVAIDIIGERNYVNGKVYSGGQVKTGPASSKSDCITYA